MKKITLFFALLFCITAVSAQDWAGTGRYEKANSELKTSPLVVFMGNSITDGWASMDPDFFTENNFLGRGIGGQVTSQMLVRFQSDVINLKPKAVVILAGINDIAHNSGYATSVQHIFENIVSMATLARANKIKVVLCTLVAADKIGWRPEIDPKGPVAELNALITEYAKANKIVVADIYKVTADENGGIKDELRNPSKDAVHPGIDGYKVMEQEVLKAISKLKIK